MSEDKPKSPVQRRPDGRLLPGSVLGGGRPPGSGNKTPVVIEEILAQRALKKQKSTLEVSALYRLYLVMDQDDAALGLQKGTITFEHSLDAAKHLSQFEASKKKAVEVTGVNLEPANYVISTGNPAPQNETNEQWAERAERETLEAEAEAKAKRLALLEAEKKG